MRIPILRALACIGLFLAFYCSLPLTLLAQNTVQASSATPPLLVYGDCPPPSHAGVTVCNPLNNYGVDTPFQLIAAGTSGLAPVRDMELWADGKKLAQSDGNIFDQPVTLSEGTHVLTVIEDDMVGHFVKSAPFTLYVYEDNTVVPCDPPAAPGVNVCTPTPNSCNVNSSLLIKAAGTGASGVVSRMELWFDGQKLANFPGNRIYTHLSESLLGTITIKEVDSKGAVLSSSFHFEGPC